MNLNILALLQVLKRYEKIQDCFHVKKNIYASGIPFNLVLKKKNSPGPQMF